MKKMFRRIVPHIIPELKLLFTLLLPLACLISLLFVFATDASYYIRKDFQLVLYGVLLSLAGLYLVRITSYAVYKIIIGIQRVIPDIYYDESNNNKDS